MSNTTSFNPDRKFQYLYTSIRKDKRLLTELIRYISEDKWKLISSKNKSNRITIHINNGIMNKPLYFDENMNLYEEGHKVRDELQKRLKDSITDFIKTLKFESNKDKTYES